MYLATTLHSIPPLTLRRDDKNNQREVNKTFFSAQPLLIKSKVMAEKKKEKDPCWKDYEQVGMKKKDGKEVPNCVPKKAAKKSKS